MGVAHNNGTQENPSIMEQAGKPVLDNGTRSHIVSGCITTIIIESTVDTQPLSFSTPPSTVNSQQSTLNNHYRVNS